MNIYRIAKAILLPVLILNVSFAQKKDIHFEEGLTWEQVKEKAKTENKYIFVDCYATWCGPCKLMDKNVYPNDTVSSFVNSNFISVKVQMDTSKVDDESVKKWYSDASSLNKQYEISAYPTFLFISPGGELVHKGVGYHSVPRFVELMSNALNPEKQYFVIMAKYNKGIRDYSKMLYLANTAYRFHDFRSAKTVADDYINNYLLNLKKEKLLTKENIDFLTTYTTKSVDKGFSVLYKNAEKIDELMKDSSPIEFFIQQMVSMEEVQPSMDAAAKYGTTPDWINLEKTMKEKYNSYYSDFVITEAKTRWYKFKKEWPKVCASTVKLVEKYLGYSDDDILSDKSWDIFLYSMDKKELKAASGWCERILGRSKDSTNMIPNITDTYANLHYKINYLFDPEKSNVEAIAIENKALEMAKKYKLEDLEKTFAETIEKMKKGEKTWKDLPVSTSSK